MFISVEDHSVHFPTQTRLKIVVKQYFLPDIPFLDISSQNYLKTLQVFQNMAKLKSITVQMISDFMHVVTIALRQRNAI